MVKTVVERKSLGKNLKKYQQETRDLMITIKRMGINGEGIGYYKKKIMFIPGALTDEVVIAKIVTENPKYIQGELVRVKQASPDRIQFPKGVNPEVGGLELAHLSYKAQLDFKTDIIRQSLEKFKPRNYRKYKIKKTIASPEEWGYRAKAQYQVERHGNQVQLGLYKPNSHELVDLPKMPTQSPLTQDTMRRIGKLIEKFDIPVFDLRTHPYGIKTIAVRQSWSTDEIQVTLITVGDNLNGLNRLAKNIMELDHVVSVFQNETEIDNPLVWGSATHKMLGQDTITERVHGKEFKLSPQAFFQLNPEQTRTLYEIALKNLDLKPTDTLIDAYSGVGTLGILAADRVDQVIGMEIIAKSVEDARINVELNHIENADYYVGKAERILPQLADEGLNFDALIVDPPRTGLDKHLIRTILDVTPDTFVYISCNPSTLARDLVPLSEKYDVRLIQSIDMFPQTARVEAIVKLVLRK